MREMPMEWHLESEKEEEEEEDFTCNTSWMVNSIIFLN
jgi:hypothetical protein